ncbi:hypothetical protein D3C77_412780 [compost metagenome]
MRQPGEGIGQRLDGEIRLALNGAEVSPAPDIIHSSFLSLVGMHHSSLRLPVNGCLPFAQVQKGKTKTTLKTIN